MTTVTDFARPATYQCPECAFRTRVDERDRAEGRIIRERRTCPTCNDAGTVTVDPDAIRDAIMRGATLRKSRPALLSAPNGVYGAAFVWRMIRFDCGADLHMPVMAFDYVGLVGLRHAADDTLRAHLDALVTNIGTDLFGPIRMGRAAAAWGSALGFPDAEKVCAIVDATVGMPVNPNGYAVGDATDSPEADAEQFSDVTWHRSNDGESATVRVTEFAH